MCLGSAVDAGLAAAARLWAEGYESARILRPDAYVVGWGDKCRAGDKVAILSGRVSQQSPEMVTYPFKRENFTTLSPTPAPISVFRRRYVPVTPRSPSHSTTSSRISPCSPAQHRGGHAPSPPLSACMMCVRRHRRHHVWPHASLALRRATLVHTTHAASSGPPVEDSSEPECSAAVSMLFSLGWWKVALLAPPSAGGSRLSAGVAGRGVCRLTAETAADARPSGGGARLGSSR